MKWWIFIVWFWSFIDVRAISCVLKFCLRLVEVSLFLKRCCSSSWNRLLFHLHFLLNFRFLIVNQILIFLIVRTDFYILNSKIWFNLIWLIYAVIIFIFKSYFFNYIIFYLMYVIYVWSNFNVLLVLNILNDILICLVRFLSSIIEISGLFWMFILGLLNWRFTHLERIFWGSHNSAYIIW